MEYSCLTTLQKKIIKVLVKHPNATRKFLVSHLNKEFPIVDKQIKILIENKIIMVNRKNSQCDKLVVNESFLEENPIFKLNGIEEQILKIIIQNPNIGKKELIRKMPIWDIDNCINNLVTYHLVTVEYRSEQQIFRVPASFIEENLDFLSEEAQNLLFTLIKYPMKNMNDLVMFMEKEIVEVLAILIQLSTYDFIYSKTIDGVERWNINEKIADAFKEQQLKKKEEMISQVSFEEFNKVDCDTNYQLPKKETEILSVIIEKPGLSNKELAVSLNMSPSALSNRLKLLLEHHFIHNISVGRNKYYYVSSAFVKSEQNDCQNKKIRLTDSEKEQEEETKTNLFKKSSNSSHRLTKKEIEVLSVIIEKPGLSNKELASSLNMSATALCNILKKLKESGFISCTRTGKNTYYYANKKDYPIENKYIDTKPLFSEEVVLSLIKNILFLSSVSDAQVLLERFAFFQSCFSVYELVQLLYALDICELDTNSLLSKLFCSKNDTKEILIRYKKICLCLEEKYEIEKGVPFIKNLPLFRRKI